MSNKKVREQKELENLFADPKYCRQAWKAVGQAILMSPATKPIVRTDKDGNDEFGYTLEKYTYAALKRDIDSLGSENREPTELEMILGCQAVKARYDTSAAVFIRDTLGAKPVDETKMDATVNNPYESLSDEELEVLAAMRERKKEIADGQLEIPQDN
jgi:hypothetical protein